MGARVCGQCRIRFPDSTDHKRCHACGKVTTVRTAFTPDEDWKHKCHQAICELRDAHGINTPEKSERWKQAREALREATAASKLLNNIRSLPEIKR